MTRIVPFALAVVGAGLAVAGALAPAAAHAQVLPPPPSLPVTTPTLPPVHVDVPGLGLSVNVDPSSGGVSTQGAVGAVGSGGSGSPAIGSTGSGATPSTEPPAPPSDEPPAPPTAAPGTTNASPGSALAAGNAAPHRDLGHDNRTFGTVVVGAITEPSTLVSALTLALGLGVVVGAAPYLPRYRRRQRELLDQWVQASERERSVAAQLARSDQEKSEFLALVSHELRTPLTAVKGFVDTVLLHWDRLPDERRRELLGRASRNADELGRLVGQLLDFARSETGRFEITPAELDVRAAVDGALRGLTPVVGEHHVEVEVPDGLAIEADANAFNHVLVNLLTNAVKFSPARSWIGVRARRTGDDVVVSVTDEGAGIPLEEQARVFDRFYQSAAGDRAPGTGIGLTIAQRFTALHGGRIWVDSEPGHGATFSFTMPAAPSPAAASPALVQNQAS